MEQSCAITARTGSIQAVSLLKGPSWESWVKSNKESTFPFCLINNLGGMLDSLQEQQEEEKTQQKQQEEEEIQHVQYTQLAGNTANLNQNRLLAALLPAKWPTKPVGAEDSNPGCTDNTHLKASQAAILENLIGADSLKMTKIKGGKSHTQHQSVSCWSGTNQ